MNRVFCTGKKDFCEDVEKCSSCRYAQGSRMIDADEADSLLTSLFGENFHLQRIRVLYHADREGKCVICDSAVSKKLWFGSVDATWHGFIENQHVLCLVTCSDDKTVRICINNDFWADREEVLEQICKAAEKAQKGDAPYEEAHP